MGDWADDLLGGRDWADEILAPPQVGVTLEGLDAERAAQPPATLESIDAERAAEDQLSQSQDVRFKPSKGAPGPMPLYPDGAGETASDFGQRTAMSATAGFGDELAGVATRGLGKVLGDRDDVIGMAEDDVVNSIRARQSLAGERSPSWSLAGDVAGGAAAAAATGGGSLEGNLLARMEGNAGLGAVWAALAGAGYADDGNRAEAAFEAAPWGGLFGAGAEAVGTGVQRAKDWAVREGAPLAKKLSGYFREGGFGTAGDYKRAADAEGSISAIDDIPETLDELGVTNRWAPQSPRGYANKLEGVRDRNGAAVGDDLAEAGRRGILLDLDDTESSLRGKAASWENGLDDTADVKAATLNDIADRLPQASPAPPRVADVISVNEPPMPPPPMPPGPRGLNAPLGEHGPAAPYLTTPPPEGMDALRMPNWLARPGGMGLDEGAPEFIYDGPEPPPWPETKASSRELARVPPSAAPEPPIEEMDPADVHRIYDSWLEPRRLRTPAEMWDVKKTYETRGGYNKRNGAPPGEGAQAEAYRQAAEVPREQVYGALREHAPDMAPGFEEAAETHGLAKNLARTARNKAASNAASAISLPSALSLGGGAAAGSFFGPVGTAVGALAGYGANRAARTYGPDLAANLAARSSEGLTALGRMPNLPQGSAAAVSRGATSAYESLRADIKRSDEDGRGQLLGDAVKKALTVNPALLGPYVQRLQGAVQSPQAMSAALQDLEREEEFRTRVRPQLLLLTRGL